jgi:type IV secretion system protein VirB3
MHNPCFLALTRPVSIAGLPMTYVVILFMAVVGGFIATLSVLWMLGSTAIGYVALRALANYDPRFLDVIFVSLTRTPPTPSWFKGKGMIYRA